MSKHKDAHRHMVGISWLIWVGVMFGLGVYFELVENVIGFHTSVSGKHGAWGVIGGVAEFVCAVTLANRAQKWYLLRCLVDLVNKK